MEKMNIANCVKRIYNEKLLMSCVFVVWFVNDIVKLLVGIFHWEGELGQNVSSKVYNILRRYHICIKFDNQLEML